MAVAGMYCKQQKDEEWECLTGKGNECNNVVQIFALCMRMCVYVCVLHPVRGFFGLVDT